MGKRAARERESGGLGDSFTTQKPRERGTHVRPRDEKKDERIEAIKQDKR